MKTPLKILAIALLFISGSASAQSEAEGDGAYALVALGRDYMSVIDTRSIEKIEPTIVHALSFVSLPKAETNLLPGKSFDSMLFLADYDCTRPGIYRHNQSQFFSMQGTGIVHKEGPTPWQVSSPGSPHHGVWGAVCFNERHKSNLKFDSSSNHAEILMAYREILTHL